MKKILSLALAISLILATTGSAYAARTGGSVNYFTSTGDGSGTVYYNAGPVAIGSSASNVASLYVQGFANLNSAIALFASSTGQALLQIGGSYGGLNSSSTRMVQYEGFGTPTLTPSTGAGTGGTSVLGAGSTDLAGSIFVYTGTTPAANANVFSFTTGSSTAPFQPYCVIHPANNQAAAGTASTTYIATSTNGFTLKSNNTALTASVAYQWNYHCN